MRRARLSAAMAAVLLAAGAGVPAARAQELTPKPRFAIAIFPPTKPVPGHVMAWTVRAFVTAERFTLRLARHSDDLRLLHRGSEPAWQLVDGRPQWSLDGLDPATETIRDLHFRMAVSRHALLGSRVCVGLRATGANGSGATERQRSTGIDRVCAKVVRRR
jgi:hypothetical protein